MHICACICIYVSMLIIHVRSWAGMCRGGVKREDEEKRKHGTEMNADPPSAPSERVSDSHETSLRHHKTSNIEEKKPDTVTSDNYAP
mmetsp:Transcript_8720/g.16514  ORF Transcript_8720/g.16514 Transcript_8720/m.16514 type:complete len:87 (-) Transcript_8720:296-556(-)